MTRAISIGSERVRVSFNPSADDFVATIKHKTAELIDLCEAIKHRDARLSALAQTAYEEAAMWAVKCATAPLPGADGAHGPGDV